MSDGHFLKNENSLKYHNKVMQILKKMYHDPNVLLNGFNNEITKKKFKLLPKTTQFEVFPTTMMIYDAKFWKSYEDRERFIENIRKHGVYNVAEALETLTLTKRMD